MKQALQNALWVRDAMPKDLAALTDIKAPTAIHTDRIRDAASPEFYYLVLENLGEVIGFACLVFVRPASWPDAQDTMKLPQIIDLVISPGVRGRGYGSFFIREMEHKAAEKGQQSLYISVDFPANKRAHALYQKLGYQQLQSEPYLDHGSSPTLTVFLIRATNGLWIWLRTSRPNNKIHCIINIIGTKNTQSKKPLTVRKP